jgi:hypothetical protein
MQAVARRFLEKLQSRLILKARLEKAPAQLKVGPAELLETALRTHREAVELNEQHGTVLAEVRACGVASLASKSQHRHLAAELKPAVGRQIHRRL